MKRILCALLVLSVVIAVPAFAAKLQPPVKYGHDGGPAVVRTTNPYVATPSKAITRVVVDSATNIRSTLGTNCRSIASNVGGTADTVQIVYLRGFGATYALWHAYSVNGGAGPWTLFNVAAANTNARPRYPALEVAANDEVNGYYQTARIAYHAQVQAVAWFAYESGTLGDNAWTYVNLSDGSVDFWTPCLTMRGNQLAFSGQDYNGGGNGTDFSLDLGVTWNANGAMALNDSFGTPGTQPALVWLNDTTLMAFVPQPRYDSQGSMNYHLSYDRGVTWTGPQAIIPETLMPQYRGSTWWYDYDAQVINGVPYVAFSNSDWTNYGGRGYSAQAIFVAWPKNVADLSQGWNIRHVSDMWDTASSNGFYPCEPSLGADAAGNIYVGYVPWGASSSASDAAVTRSTDGGLTWSAPLHFMGSGAVHMDPFEISRTVGTNVYGVACDSSLGLAKLPVAVYTIPVADIAAQPVRSQNDMYMAPSQPLTGVAWTGDTLVDTMTVTTAGIEWAWQPGFGYGGKYELTIAKTADWSDGATNYDLAWMPDSNDLIINGMPSDGRWYYKVRSIRPDNSVTDWSGIYTFTYLGGVANTTDWVNPSGVVSKPVETAHYSFAVKAAYPNPASARTTISFQLPKAGAYSVKVYNIAGQVVKTMNGQGNVGPNSVVLSTKDICNGVYFYQVSSNGNTATRKLTVVR